MPGVVCREGRSEGAAVLGAVLECHRDDNRSYKYMGSPAVRDREQHCERADCDGRMTIGRLFIFCLISLLMWWGLWWLVR